MNSGRAFVAGIVGALVMSLLMVLLRAAGVPLHIELRLAAALGTRIWLIGFATHLADWRNSSASSTPSCSSTSPKRSGIGPGVLLGAVNTIFAGFAWAFVGGPGRFWSDFGPAGVGALFLVHIVYGAVVGGLYKKEHRPVYL